MFGEMAVGAFENKNSDCYFSDILSFCPNLEYFRTSIKFAASSLPPTLKHLDVRYPPSNLRRLKNLTHISVFGTTSITYSEPPQLRIISPTVEVLDLREGGKGLNVRIDANLMPNLKTLHTKPFGYGTYPHIFTAVKLTDLPQNVPLPHETFHFFYQTFHFFSTRKEALENSDIPKECTIIAYNDPYDERTKKEDYKRSTKTIKKQEDY